MRQIIYIIGTILLATSCQVIPEDERLLPIDLEQSNRTTLLVEFSALQCVNCPLAAEEAHNMITLHQDRLVVVEMHPASNKLTAAKPEWDYTCEEADIYYTHFGGTNSTPFPTGVINFAKVKDEYFLSHSLWEAAYTAAAAIPSYVDITLDVTTDDGAHSIEIESTITNLATIDVEVQYILWLTEDSIVGPQLMPDGALNQNYSHNHMLRDAITDVWGTPLHLAANQSNSQIDTYIMPEKVNPINCNVVAIVLKNNEVIQAKEYKLKNK